MDNEGRVRNLVWPLVAAFALALVAAACGDDDSSDEVGSDSTVVAGPTSSETSTSLTATTDQSDTTDGTDSTDTTDDDSTTRSGPTTSSGPTTLPGEPFDGFADDGDVLAVMGVAADDVLNIRAVPGESDIVATAGPTADDVVATGEARLLPRSIWYEVTVDGVTGWASASFLGFVGVTDDATAEFLDGGPIPVEETMQDLGELVADGFASEDPESNVVQSVAPTVGDLGEVTYDVIGIGDDAVAGFRLHVFGTPTESGEGFALKSIERTTFCSRGLSGELCA